MLKRKIKWLVALALLVFLGIYLLPGNVYSILMGNISEQYEFTMEQIVDSASTLKDFRVNKDGSITSTSDDPWIVIDYNEFGVKRPKTVNVIIDEATNIGEQTAVFSCGTYEHDLLTIGIGDNNILFSCGNRDDSAIRFDLTAKENQTLKVSKIIFNDKSQCGLEIKKELIKIIVVLFCILLLICGLDIVDRNSKIQYLYVGICTFTLRILFLMRDSNYNINPDRIGDFIAPVTMAGRDWSLLVQHVNYYGYGFKWIYSLFFVFTSNPYIIYYCMMVMYAVLMSGIAMLVYNIQINGFKIQNKYIAILLSIFMGIIQPGDFKSEPSLYMAGWIVCYLLIKAIREGKQKSKYINAVLIALFLAYTITLHERMIAIILAFAILLVFCKIKCDKWIVSPIVYYPVQIISFFIVEKINALYRIYFWGRADVGNSSIVLNTDIFRQNYLGFSDRILASKMSTFNFAELVLPMKFTYFLNPQGLKIAISCMWSNIVTLITQTYGVGFIAILLGFYLLFLPKLKDKLSEEELISCITIWLFGLCVLIVMVGIVVNWGSGVYAGNLYNYKGFVYGRYYLNFVYPALVAAFAWLVNHKVKLVGWGIGTVGFVGVIVVFLYEIYPTLLSAFNTYIPEEFTSDTSLYWILIDSVIGDIKKDLILDISIITIIFICIFAASRYISMYYVAVIMYIMITIFVNTGHFNISSPKLSINNNCYDNTYAFVNAIEDKGIDIHNYVLYTDCGAWPLQYMLNEYTIEYQYPTENEAIFISRNAPDYEWGEKINIFDYNYIDLDGEYFYFKSNNLESEFQKNGIEYQLINKIIKNVNEKTLHIDGNNGKKKIVIINDLHIINPSDEIGEEYIELVNERWNNMAVNTNGEHSSDNWVEMAREINDYNADLVIFNGDLLDFYSKANINCLKEGMKEIEAPIMYIRSDHDYSLHYTGDKIDINEVMEEHSKLDGNPEVWEMDMDGFVVIGISNSFQEMTDVAFEKINKIFDKNIPTIIVTHVPYDSSLDSSFRDECFEKRGKYNMWGTGDRYVPGENMGIYLDKILSEKTALEAIWSAHLHYDREVALTEDVVQTVLAPSYEGNIAIFTID